MKEELLTGLKNAIERGQSLEKAIQTLISAGYNSSEVHEAAESINAGTIGEISKQEIKQSKDMMPVAPISGDEDIKYKPLPGANVVSSAVIASPKRKIPKWLIALLIFIGFLIIFIVLFSIFGENILNAIFGKKG